MLITIAIPCYRSEKNLVSVITEIRETFQKHSQYDYQIILVCDGSPDNTSEVIRCLCKNDSRIIGILLSRNFTQSNAKMAALPYAKGEILVYMDDDGQHAPDDIFKLINKVEEGYDVVYARFEEKQESALKKLTSDFYGFLSVKFGLRPKGIKTSSFIAYSRFCVDQLLNYNSPSPNMGGFLYSLTTKFANVDCVQRKRKSGKSGYNFSKMFSLAIMALTNFTIVPLRIMDAMGLIFALLGMIYGFILVLRRMIGSVVPGYTSNMVVILILGGLILIGLGIVGEYVGRMYMLLSRKPQYVVREEINTKKE